MTERDQFAFNVAILQCVMENAKIIHTLSAKVDLSDRPDLQCEVIDCQERYFKAFDECMKAMEKRPS